MMNAYSINNSPGRTAFANNKEYLFFSGYNYLDMQHVPAFAKLVKEGMEKCGWLFPSSRISNTQLALFRECEAALSNLTGMEDTVLVSSGFLAGQLATEKWKHEITNLSPSHPAIQREHTQKQAAQTRKAASRRLSRCPAAPADEVVALMRTGAAVLASTRSARR